MPAPLEILSPESLGFKRVTNQIDEALEKLLKKQITEEEFSRIFSQHTNSMLAQPQCSVRFPGLKQ